MLFGIVLISLANLKTKEQKRQEAAERLLTKEGSTLRTIIADTKAIRLGIPNREHAARVTKQLSAMKDLWAVTLEEFKQLPLESSEQVAVIEHFLKVHPDIKENASLVGLTQTLYAATAKSGKRQSNPIDFP